MNDPDKVFEILFSIGIRNEIFFDPPNSMGRKVISSKTCICIQNNIAILLRMFQPLYRIQLTFSNSSS